MLHRENRETYYLTLDTNAWIYLANGTEPIKLLNFIAQGVESGYIQLIIPDLVIKEWHDNKVNAVEKGVLKYFSNVTQSFDRLISLIGDKQKKESSLFHFLFENDDLDNNENELLGDLVLKFKEKKKDVEDAVKENIKTIEYLFTHPYTEIIRPANKIALKAGRFALDKKAPFLKKNSFADAMIMFSFIDYVESNGIIGGIFISYNTDDFCEKRNSKNYLHPHLSPEFRRSGSKFYTVLGEALNSIQEDLISLDELEFIKEVKLQFEEEEEEGEIEFCRFCLENDGTQHKVEFQGRQRLNDERVSGWPASQLSLSIVNKFAKKTNFEVLHSIIVGECSHCETEHFKCASCGNINSVEEDEYDCRKECATCRTPYYIDTKQIEADLSDIPLGREYYEQYSSYRLIKNRVFCSKCDREYLNEGPGFTICEQCQDEEFFEQLSI